MPQSFFPSHTLLSLVGFCWRPGPLVPAGHVTGLQTDPQAELGGLACSHIPRTAVGSRPTLPRLGLRRQQWWGGMGF